MGLQYCIRDDQGVSFLGGWDDVSANDPWSTEVSRILGRESTGAVGITIVGSNGYTINYRWKDEE